jgi:hypothetical protein
MDLKIAYVSRRRRERRIRPIGTYLAEIDLDRSLGMTRGKPRPGFARLKLIGVSSVLRPPDIDRICRDCLKRIASLFQLAARSMPAVREPAMTAALRQEPGGDRAGRFATTVAVVSAGALT